MGRSSETWEMTGGIKIVSEHNLGSYVTLHPTNTTNTFTPTTLKTIEQMFVDVEEPETYKNQAGFAPPTLKHKTYINMDSSNWQQGGVTTVVTPSPAPQLIWFPYDMEELIWSFLISNTSEKEFKWKI